MSDHHQRQRPKEYVAALEHVRQAYKTAFEQYGDNPQALLVSSQRSLDDRYKALLDIGDMNDKRVLDVGCGLCGLYVAMMKRYPNARYTGLEILPEFVNQARKRFLDVEVVAGSIDNIDPNRRWDYVVESGIFNTRPYCYAAVEYCLREMFRRTTPMGGVAANFLSRHSTGTYNNTAVYYDPIQLIGLATKLTRRFALRHDYRTNDFTLYMWRDESFPGTELQQGVIPEHDPASETASD